MKTCFKILTGITLLGFLLVSLFVADTTLALADEYRYIKLRGALPWDDVKPAGINNKGEVVGSIFRTFLGTPCGYQCLSTQRGFIY